MPKRILIVDDDAYNAAFLTMEMESVLEKLGLPTDIIEMCYDGESAINSFKKSLDNMTNDS